MLRFITTTRTTRVNTFTITHTHHDRAEIVHLHGYLDAHTASQFERDLRVIIEQGATHVIVDFEHLDYISSAGLGVFMVFIEDIRKQGGDILLAAMRDNVFSVFDLLGFQVLFRIFPTVDEAMAALSNNA